MKAPWRVPAHCWAALHLLPGLILGAPSSHRGQVSSPQSAGVDASLVDEVGAASGLVKRKCPGLDCIAPVSVPEPLPDVTIVWRGELRSPEVLKQSGGFYARGIERLLKGEKLPIQQIQQGSTLLDHARGNPELVTRYISTTTDVVIAAEKFVGKKGYVYLIQADEKMVDLHHTLGDAVSPFPDQLEQVAVGRIPWEQVRGWFEVQDIKDINNVKDGALSGTVPEDVRAILQTDPERHVRFHKNPDFRPQDWQGKKSSGIQPSLAGAGTKVWKDADAWPDPIYNLDKFVRDVIGQQKPGQGLWDWAASSAVPLRETELGNWHKDLAAVQSAVEQARAQVNMAASSQDVARGAEKLEESLHTLTTLGRNAARMVLETPALSTIEIRWDELSQHIQETRVAMTNAKMGAHYWEAEELFRDMELVRVHEPSQLAEATRKIEDHASRIDAEVEAASKLKDELRQLSERLRKAVQSGLRGELSSLVLTPGFTSLVSRENPGAGAKRLRETVQMEMDSIRGADIMMEGLRKKSQAIVKAYKEAMGHFDGAKPRQGKEQRPAQDEAGNALPEADKPKNGDAGSESVPEETTKNTVDGTHEGFSRKWETHVIDARNGRMNHAIKSFELETDVVFVKGQDLGIDLAETVRQTRTKNPATQWTEDSLWDRWQKHLVQKRVFGQSELDATLRHYKHALSSFQTLYQNQGLPLVREGKLGFDFAKTLEQKPAGVELSEAQLQDAWRRKIEQQRELSEMLSASPLCKRSGTMPCPILPDRSSKAPHYLDLPSSAKPPESASDRLAQRAQQLSDDEFAKLVQKKGLGSLIKEKWPSLKAARETVGYKPLTSSEVKQLADIGSSRKIKFAPKVSTVLNFGAWAAGVGLTIGQGGDAHDLTAAVLAFAPYTGCVTQFNADRHHGRASTLDYSACMIADRLLSTRLAPIGIAIHVGRFFVSLWEDGEPVPDDVGWQDLRDRSWRRLLQGKVYSRVYVEDPTVPANSSFHTEIRQKFAINALAVLSEGAKQVGLMKAVSELSSDGSIDNSTVPSGEDVSGSMDMAIARLNRQVLLDYVEKFNHEMMTIAKDFENSFYDSIVSEDVIDHHKSSFLKRLITFDVITGSERDKIKEQLRQAQEALRKVPLSMPNVLEWPYILGQSSALAQLDDETLSPAAWLRDGFSTPPPDSEIRTILRVHESSIAKLVYTNGAVRLPTKIRNFPDQNETTVQEFHRLIAMKQGKIHDKDKREEASSRWVDRQVQGKPLPGVQDYMRQPTTFESSIPKLDRSNGYDKIKQSLVQALDKEARLLDSDVKALTETTVVPYHVVDKAIRTRDGAQRLY